jgi:hypothetical protein
VLLLKLRHLRPQYSVFMASPAATCAQILARARRSAYINTTSFFTHIQKRRTSSIRIYKYQVVSRDLALSAFPFVRLFNTLQFRLAMYSHARAQRHLFGVSSRRQRRYRRREGGSSLDRVDEAGILICDVRQGRLIGASLCGLYLLCFVLDLC